MGVAAGKLFERSVEENHITLKAEVPRHLPKLVADKGAVEQILTNLIGNALKFTGKEGKVTLSAKVDRTTGSLTLQVADNGVGIPENELAHIAEPFHQVRSTLTSDNSGVGLGLSLVSLLARLHQATVAIDSKIGKGTNVSVTFPAARVIAAPERRLTVRRSAGAKAAS